MVFIHLQFHPKDPWTNGNPTGTTVPSRIVLVNPVNIAAIEPYIGDGTLQGLNGSKVILANGQYYLDSRNPDKLGRDILELVAGDTSSD